MSISSEQVEKLLTYSFIKNSIENIFGRELRNIHYTEIDIPSIDGRTITSKDAIKYMSENYFQCADDKIINLEEILGIIDEKIVIIETIFKDKEEEFKKKYKEKFGKELENEKVDSINTISNNCKYVVTWLMCILSNNKLETNSEEIIDGFILFLDKLTNVELKAKNRFLYNEKLINFRLISDLDAFTGVIYDNFGRAENDNKTMCYRGHSNRKYRLLPSILRDNNFIKEDILYNYIQVKCPNDFAQCKSHIEKLVLMQHSEAPTRLLDITFNPLVALYFACQDETVSGEIVLFYFDKNKFKKLNSDTISILSSLSALKYDIKNKLLQSVNSCKKYKKDGKNEFYDKNEFNSNKCVDILINEIHLDKPSFEKIIVPKDIISVFPVYALQNNQRIIRQDGGFLIYGLDNEDNSKLLKNAEFYTVILTENQLHVHYIIDKGAKKKILEKLAALDIKKSSLFPDIKYFANDIIN